MSDDPKRPWLRGSNLIAMIQAHIYNLCLHHGPKPDYDKTDLVQAAVTEFAVSKAIMDGARIRHTAARDALLKLFKPRIPTRPTPVTNVFKTPLMELDVAVNRPSASINKKQLEYILTTKYRLTVVQTRDIIAYASQGGEGKPAVQLLVRLSE